MRNMSLELLLSPFLFAVLLSSAHARIGYFWHITDLHLDTIYSMEGDARKSCWQLPRSGGASNGMSVAAASSPETPGAFGDYHCDSPWSLIESAVKTMKAKQGDNVEFVLWTGDALSHSAQPLSELKQHEILRNITELLGRSFSSQFIFPVLGHEDGTPHKYKQMGELWRHWLPSEALLTFEQGGYYSIEQTKSRLRIVALNTNFMRHDPKVPQANGNGIRWPAEYYTEPRASSSAQVPDEDLQQAEQQWLWLEEVLTKSRNKQETVYIVGHMPPGADERHLGPQHNGQLTFTERNNKRYLELVRKYASVIQGQFFGHLHSDTFRIVYDEHGTPISWLMIAPSIAPRKSGIGSNNPALRLYKFDTGNGQVVDYTQYWMDLPLANRANEPLWLPEYNLTHYYALNDISAIALHNFAERFTGSDTSWFSRYYRANAVRHQSGSPCLGLCMLNHYCAITRLDYDEFRQCLETEQLSLHSHAAIAALSSCCALFSLCVALSFVCCWHYTLPWMLHMLDTSATTTTTTTATTTSTPTATATNMDYDGQCEVAPTEPNAGFITAIPGLLLPAPNMRMGVRSRRQRMSQLANL
ncbi:acid sphingomyelinase-like phosphodiesterase 3b [Scaptodrosophila lebanonensis]|uniref:Acid sphingomyelinase-like phosphodiesterase 3b n=1 Tax=Drosophila lebanonensis TaxID=7225 RepID=A0A6J2TAL1_DROLE|nr:acid sphingomyelinase-like phosphodiesterase 3b [Scaptodrosophila lebanonensis]